MFFMVMDGRLEYCGRLMRGFQLVETNKPAISFEVVPVLETAEFWARYKKA